MNILVIILFLSAVSPYCTACQSSSRNKFANEVPFATTNSSKLNFTAGDIISCNINNIGSHIFLASSNSNVIYIEGDTADKMPFKTRIAEKPFKLVTKAYGTCDVITEFYDENYAAKCNGGPYPTAEILSRARSSLNKFVRMYTNFDNWNCNSEHWVSAWRYGTSWTLQTPFFADKYRGDDCEAPGLQKCNVQEETDSNVTPTSTVESYTGENINN